MGRRVKEPFFRKEGFGEISNPPSIPPFIKGDRGGFQFFPVKSFITYLTLPCNPLYLFG